MFLSRVREGAHPVAKRDPHSRNATGIAEGASCSAETPAAGSTATAASVIASATVSRPSLPRPALMSMFSTGPLALALAFIVLPRDVLPEVPPRRNRLRRWRPRFAAPGFHPPGGAVPPSEPIGLWLWSGRVWRPRCYCAESVSVLVGTRVRESTRQIIAHNLTNPSNGTTRKPRSSPHIATMPKRQELVKSDSEEGERLRQSAHPPPTPHGCAWLATSSASDALLVSWGFSRKPLARNTASRHAIPASQEYIIADAGCVCSAVGHARLDQAWKMMDYDVSALPTSTRVSWAEPPPHLRSEKRRVGSPCAGGMARLHYCRAGGVVEAVTWVIPMSKRRTQNLETASRGLTARLLDVRVHLRRRTPCPSSATSRS